MSLVTPNAGELELLTKMLKSALTVDEDYVLKLFSNDYTPVNSTVVGDFTESAFGGYASKTLTRAGWNAASTVTSKAQMDYGTTQSWTCNTTVGGTIYGYFVLAATSGTCLWAERFNVARTVSNGDILQLIPSVSLNSEVNG